MNQFLIVVAGPTAVGKTALSIELANIFNTEIISADSRQFYKELIIGTAKPSTEQLNSVPHHFINSISIHQNYTVADFEKQGIELLDRLFKEKKIVILSGGSGLFIDAICKGLDSLPEADEEIRSKLQLRLELGGITNLQEELKLLDPVAFQKIDLQNPRRLMRALEVCLVSGKPYSDFLKKTEETSRNFKTIKIVLNLERKLLYKRIDERVDEMIHSGLVNEVEKLKSHMHLNALNTVGYKEFKDHFENLSSLETCIEQIKQNSRRYAKRQLTWFRKDKEYTWFSPTEKAGIIEYIEKLTN